VDEPLDLDVHALAVQGRLGEVVDQRGDGGPVTPVELFFDVVFVFTITQLTRVFEKDLTLAGAGRVLLIFSVLWWMYSGYAWLTNHVPPRRVSQKLLLFAGMVGFMLAAVGIPHVFDGTRILFGAAYLVVICVHLLLFTQSDALATIPIGTSVHAGLQLAAVAAVVAGMLVIEARRASAKAHVHA
jgi:low temperature requirement protein LtrA